MDDYTRIAKAIDYLAGHEGASLEQAADNAGLSPAHFQRLFSRWAGVSPKRFTMQLSRQRARQALAAGRSVLEASLEAGLSGPGRLHDLMVHCEAVTPGAARRGGDGVEVRWGHHPTPYGAALIAVTERGVCFLGFGEDAEPLRRALADRWPGATLIEDPPATAAWVRRVFEPAPGKPPLPMHLRGTNFQLQVWEALLRLPPGTAATYGDLARSIGRAGAARAVGRAVGSNPIALLVPCHRVLQASGALGGYRWGPPRKRAILAAELADEEAPQPASANTGPNAS